MITILYKKCMMKLDRKICHFYLNIEQQIMLVVD